MANNYIWEVIYHVMDTSGTKRTSPAGKATVIAAPIQVVQGSFTENRAPSFATLKAVLTSNGITGNLDIESVMSARTPTALS